jgi:hypothetical protein
MRGDDKEEGDNDVALTLRDDAAAAADTSAYRLLLASTPPRVFKARELQLSLADVCALSAVGGATTRAAAAATPAHVLHLAAESAGTAAQRVWAALKVAPRCTANVLRLAASWWLHPGLPSPIVHLRNVDGARGAKLFAALRTLLHPNEWHKPATGQLSYRLLPLRVDQAAAAPMSGMHMYTASDYRHPSTEPMQAYARAAVLHRAAAAVRVCRDTAHACCAAAAANDLEASRSFTHVLGVLYSLSGMMVDHEDNHGSYGCCFRSAARLISLSTTTLSSLHQAMRSSSTAVRHTRSGTACEACAPARARRSCRRSCTTSACPCCWLSSRVLHLQLASWRCAAAGSGTPAIGDR